MGGVLGDVQSTGNIVFVHSSVSIPRNQESRMFLKRIRMHNIRCIENLEICFDAPGTNVRKWTLLLNDRAHIRS
jgi:hypothetical protein